MFALVAARIAPPSSRDMDGTMPITIIFTLSQMPLIMKHTVTPKPEGEK